MAEISKVNIPLAKRYDRIIVTLQNIIIEARDILDEAENKNLVLNSERNKFIAHVELVIKRALSAFDIVSERRSELYSN